MIEAFFGLVGGGFIGYGVRSYQVQRYFKKLKCQHIWGKWEECVLLDGWHWVNGDKLQKTVPGQSRECQFCGEREVRKITA